jgi:hypothetical protein
MNIPKHAHTDFEGAKISFTDSGKRHHPGKFPNRVPNSHKEAIRWALKLDDDVILETKIYFDSENNELIILVEDIHE